jgi:hypothetical protein
LTNIDQKDSVQEELDHLLSHELGPFDEMPRVNTAMTTQLPSHSLAIGYSVVVSVEKITMWKFHANTAWLVSNQYPLGVTHVLHEMARKH